LTADSPIAYKVDELSPVTEEGLEELLNERSGEGWGFESIHFAMREGSHRPAMAFVFFVRARGALRRLAGRAGARPRRSG
jgi:hypothetical protein